MSEAMTCYGLYYFPFLRPGFLVDYVLLNNLDIINKGIFTYPLGDYLVISYLTRYYFDSPFYYCNVWIMIIA